VVARAYPKAVKPAYWDKPATGQRWTATTTLSAFKLDRIID